MKKSIVFILGFMVICFVAIFGGLELVPDTAILMTVPFILGVKDSLTLIDERATLVDEFENLVNLARGESRAFTEDEKKRKDEIKREINELDKQIMETQEYEAIKARNAGNGLRKGVNNPKTDEEKLKERFSLSRAISLIAEKKSLDGAEAEINSEGIKEARISGCEVKGTNSLFIPGRLFKNGQERDVTATGQTSVAGDQGGVAVPTMIERWLDYLWEMLVLRQAGADFMTGLVGNIDMIKDKTVPLATWKTEVANLDKSDPTFENVTMTPKRLGTYVDYSFQIGIQVPSVERRLFTQILNAIYKALDQAGINGSGVAPIPEGIINATGVAEVSMGDNGGNITHEKVVELMSNVDDQEALMGSLGFVTNSKVHAKLLTTKVDAGSGRFLMDVVSNSLIGYPAYFSNLVPKNGSEGSGTNLSTMVFGNFNDLIIGQWGPLQIKTVEDATLAIAGKTRIVANIFADVLVQRAASFSFSDDIIID
jgi:HK97 family phage major capsid protein